MADEINSYFTGIASELANKFDGEPVKTERTLHHPKMHLKTVAVDHVKKLILSLSPSSAVGDDCISPRVLRAAMCIAEASFLCFDSFLTINIIAHYERCD